MYVLITREAKHRHRAREGARREEKRREGRERGRESSCVASGDVREGGAKVKRGESSM
jgi:hypothetical protein